MADPLATVDDLADWLGEAITVDVDIARASRYLSFASNLVRAFAGASRVETGGEREAEAIDVVLSIVGRKWTNPTDATQVSDTLGGATHSESRGPEGSNGLYLTDAEKLMLRKDRNGLWVQPTSRGTVLDQPDVFVPVLGGNPVPFLEDITP